MKKLIVKYEDLIIVETKQKQLEPFRLAIRVSRNLLEIIDQYDNNEINLRGEYLIDYDHIPTQNEVEAEIRYILEEDYGIKE